MHRCTTFLATALLATSCGYNRTSIRPVPEKDAPRAERVKAFKDLKTESGLATSYFKNGVYQGTFINSVMLADGTRIEDPRDLLPAVDFESPTASYILSFEDKANKAKTWGIAGWSVFGAGLAAMLIPVAVSGTSDTKALFVGLGIGGGIELLSLVPFFVGASYANGAQADRVSAFQSYPKALERRLDLEDEAAYQPPQVSPAQVAMDRPVRLLLPR